MDKPNGKFFKFKPDSKLEPPQLTKIEKACSKLYRIHPVVVLAYEQSTGYVHIVTVTSHPKIEGSYLPFGPPNDKGSLHLHGDRLPMNSFISLMSMARVPFSVLEPFGKHRLTKASLKTVRKRLEANPEKVEQQKKVQHAALTAEAATYSPYSLKTSHSTTINASEVKNSEKAMRVIFRNQVAEIKLLKKELQKWKLLAIGFPGKALPGTNTQPEPLRKTKNGTPAGKSHHHEPSRQMPGAFPCLPPNPLFASNNAISQGVQSKDPAGSMSSALPGGKIALSMTFSLWQHISCIGLLVASAFVAARL